MKPARTNIRSLAVLAAVVAATTGCSVMEGAGRWTRETGESWENYSKTNDGFLASVAGFGGKVNKAVGGTVESIARGDDETAAPAEQKTAAPAATSQRAAAPAASAPVITPAPSPVATTSAPVPVAAMSAPGATSQTSVNARAQVRLQELGYNVGPADGVIGAKTRAAIQQYQRKQGLAVTGSLDSATLAALGLAAPTASRSGRGA
jgi:localization factor PodJL